MALREKGRRNSLAQLCFWVWVALVGPGPASPISNTQNPFQTRWFSAVTFSPPRICICSMGARMPVLSPPRAMATEVGTVLIRTVLVSGGCALAGLGHLGDQSDRFQ
jgi:hypothetical protein